MNARATALGALAVVTVAAGVAATGGSSDDAYRVRLQLHDALGLRDGSKVVMGGVEVGRVEVDVDDRDRVIALAKIEPEHAPIGRDAEASIRSVNLLGQKSLELSPGNRDEPAPDGFTITQGRISPSTDLDQVLAVLDPDTRSRLAVLLNEAGAAFSGRREDFSRFLAEMPSSLRDATALLERLVADEHTLASLVRKSDRFVGVLASEREQLSDLLDTVGRSAETVSARRAALAETLDRLPGTLGSAQDFLADLRETTKPLGPAARRLQQTAGPLDDVLEQVAPFTSAASPALAQAHDVAPRLTRLATGATPVLRRALPAAGALSTTSKELEPISRLLDRSAHNIVGTASNWAHAIQFRDGLGHVFRAEVGVTPQTLDAMIDRLISGNRPAAKRKRRDRAATQNAAPRSPKADSPPPKVDVPRLRVPQVDRTVEGIRQLLKEVVPARPGERNAGEHLLDFLLKP